MSRESMEKRAKEIVDRTQAELDDLNRSYFEQHTISSKTWNEKSYKLSRKRRNANNLYWKYAFHERYAPSDGELRIYNCNERGILESNPTYQKLVALSKLPEETLRKQYLGWDDCYHDNPYRNDIRKEVQNIKFNLWRLERRMRSRSMKKDDYEYLLGVIFSFGHLVESVKEESHLGKNQEAVLV